MKTIHGIQYVMTGKKKLILMILMRSKKIKTKIMLYH